MGFARDESLRRSVVSLGVERKHGLLRHPLGARVDGILPGGAQEVSERGKLSCEAGDQSFVPRLRDWRLTIP